MHDDIESVFHLVPGAVLSFCPVLNSVQRCNIFPPPQKTKKTNSRLRGQTTTNPTHTVIFVWG